MIFFLTTRGMQMIKDQLRRGSCIRQEERVRGFPEFPEVRKGNSVLRCKWADPVGPGAGGEPHSYTTQTAPWVQQKTSSLSLIIRRFLLY